jgi:hypothetical protein
MALSLGGEDLTHGPDGAKPTRCETGSRGGYLPSLALGGFPASVRSFRPVLQIV